MITAITRAVNALRMTYKLSQGQIAADEAQRSVRLVLGRWERVYKIPPYTEKAKIMSMLRPAIKEYAAAQLKQLKKSQGKLF